MRPSTSPGRAEQMVNILDIINVVVQGRQRSRFPPRSREGGPSEPRAPAGDRPAGGAPPRRRQQRCFNCDSNGHIARDCPEAPQPKRCHNCKGTDHLVADCPQVRNLHILLTLQTKAQ